MGSSTPGLTEDGRTEAREAAVRLLEATLSLMDAPPVALCLICRRLDIDVYARPCSAFGAILVEAKGRRIMLVNSSASLERARFSMAHELGHFLLRHRATRQPPMALDERQERQADCFAAELLMPASLLSAEKSGMTALCRRYRVSRQAMTFRLRSLGLTASR